MKKQDLLPHVPKNLWEGPSFIIAEFRGSLFVSPLPDLAFSFVGFNLMQALSLEITKLCTTSVTVPLKANSLNVTVLAIPHYSLSLAHIGLNAFFWEDSSPRHSPIISEVIPSTDNSGWGEIALKKKKKNTLLLEEG